MDGLFFLFVFLGALSGFFIGAIPGLSVSMAMSLLVSFTYSWDAHLALALAMGIYVVGVYAGSYASILLNIPGAPGSVVTALDGYSMTLQKKSSQAIQLATVYSFIGSFISFVLLFLLAKPMASMALAFRPHDFLLVAIASLLVLLRLESKQLFKAICSMFAGFFFSQVGMDPIWGQARLTFQLPSLQGGIALVPVLIGIFGLAEALLQMRSLTSAVTCPTRVDKSENKLAFPPHAGKDEGWNKVLKHKALGLWSSLIGALVGALPGAGAPVAAFFAYAFAGKRHGDKKPALGEGAPEGIVASEAANNACVGGALIPLLTLGIPGDAVTAILLATFTLHGLRPGPLFLAENKEIFYAILAAGILASVSILLLGALAQRLVRHLFTIPRYLLFPIVVVLCILGAYTANQRMIDVWVMLFFTAVGIFLRKAEFSLPAFILAFVLGGMIDVNFRRTVSLLLVEENIWHYFTQGYVTPVLVILLLLICLSWLRAFLRKKNSVV